MWGEVGGIEIKATQPSWGWKLALSMAKKRAFISLCEDREIIQTKTDCCVAMTSYSDFDIFETTVRGKCIRIRVPKNKISQIRMETNLRKEKQKVPEEKKKLYQDVLGSTSQLKPSPI